MVKLLKYLEKKDWLIMLLIVILVISQMWLALKLPDYMSEKMMKKLKIQFQLLTSLNWNLQNSLIKKIILKILEHIEK